MSTAAKKRKLNSDEKFDRAMKLAMTAKPNEVKVHLTCRIDSDIYLELRKRAKKSGGKYQSLMNDLLRASLFSGSKSLAKRIEALEELEAAIETADLCVGKLKIAAKSAKG
jgi:uncharacterized protein (DUF4415 family)